MDEKTDRTGKGFRKLIAWQKAHQLVLMIYNLAGFAQNKLEVIMKTNTNKFFVGVSIGMITILIGVLGSCIIKPLLGQTFTGPNLPSATLEIQNKEQTGEITGCWWDGSCPDFFDSIFTPKDALVISSPFNATLKLFKDTSPSTVSINIIIAANMKRISPNRWNTGGVSFNNYSLLKKELLPQKEQTINLELKKGLYILLISARWGQNEVWYGFWLMCNLCAMK